MDPADYDEPRYSMAQLLRSMAQLLRPVITAGTPARSWTRTPTATMVRTRMSTTRILHANREVREIGQG